MVEIAFYDDEFETANERVLMELVDWLQSQEDCAVRRFARAKDLIEAVTSGYRPHLAVIDVRSEYEQTTPRTIREKFDAAKAAGLDIDRVLNPVLIRQRKLESWLEQRYYGVGLLALLRAARCEARMAFTQFADNSDVVEVLTQGSVANWGVCHKETDKAKERLVHALAEVREVLAAQRDVPDPFEVVVIDDVDATNEFGDQLRLAITEKKTA